MYSRRNGEQLYSFEPSGGLLNASLVMRDRETDSYWSIISDEAIHGAAKGESLAQLPGSVKMTFGDWRTRHPKTLVLSVNGVEHEPKNPYDRYFAASGGFRGWEASDRRLQDKDELFGFHHGGKAWAVPHPAFENDGALLEVDGSRLFIYRRVDDSMYRSTVAYFLQPGLELKRNDGRWQLLAADGSSFSFDEKSRSFKGAGDQVEAASGFDTFWYIWSLTNEKTELLGSPGPAS